MHGITIFWFQDTPGSTVVWNYTSKKWAFHRAVPAVVLNCMAESQLHLLHGIGNRDRSEAKKGFLFSACSCDKWWGSGSDLSFCSFAPSVPARNSRLTVQWCLQSKEAASILMALLHGLTGNIRGNGRDLPFTGLYKCKWCDCTR